MNDEQFKVCVDIIRACRDLDSFTNHEAGLRTGNSTEFIKWFTNKMLYIGCLRKVGITRHNRHVSPLFAISPDAVTGLYRYVCDSRGELMRVVSRVRESESNFAERWSAKHTLSGFRTVDYNRDGRNAAGSALFIKTVSRSVTCVILL